jgi:carbamoyltransferase
MSYNVLGIHPGHNGAAALVSDGELVYYLEEERLSRFKRDGNPFRAMIDIFSKYHVDELVIGGTMDPNEVSTLSWTGETAFEALARKFNPKIKIAYIRNEHHLAHAACAFYNSGFEESIVIIVDGAGSYKKVTGNNWKTIEGWENETVYIANYPSDFEVIYQTFGNNDNNEILFDVYHKKPTPNIAKTYEAVSMFLGFGELEAGKTMGLAPYGKQNPKIPNLWENHKSNSDVFKAQYPKNSLINSDLIPLPHRTPDYYNNINNLSEIDLDLAWQIQNDTQEEVAHLVSAALQNTEIKNVCIAGGYGLNCVANYFLTKKFPEVNFYFEPIAHDGGTAIGGAKLYSYNNKPDLKSYPQTTLYHGPKYDKSTLLNSLDKSKFDTQIVEPEFIAQIISKNNIVALYQGGSEAGPRALGNRSILYNPTDPNGQDFVNKVKKREFFRPFAGSVLKEKSSEWFDMAGLEESPFMMYAMDVWPDKQEIIQAITHVDGTCRIQTVTEEQNPHYYKLIQEFEKITGVPILFNTSFNLAGEPLVETIEDAYKTLLNSDINYLYLPELNTLITKK